eukprot:7578531-Pyramimonas_sp.AAC.2
MTYEHITDRCPEALRIRFGAFQRLPVAIHFGLPQIVVCVGHRVHSWGFGRVEGFPQRFHQRGVGKKDRGLGSFCPVGLEPHMHGVKRTIERALQLNPAGIFLEHRSARLLGHDH